MYIIQNSSQDFPDGAQRFNWCSCQGETRKKLGLAGLGETPIFDFSFWNTQLSGGGQKTATPAAVSNWLPSLPPAPAAFGGSWIVPGVIVAGAAFYFMNRKGGRR